MLYVCNSIFYTRPFGLLPHTATRNNTAHAHLFALYTCGLIKNVIKLTMKCLRVRPEGRRGEGEETIGRVVYYEITTTTTQRDNKSVMRPDSFTIFIVRLCEQVTQLTTAFTPYVCPMSSHQHSHPT